MIRRIICIVGLTLLSFSIAIYMLANKFGFVPKVVLNDMYFYSICAGIPCILYYSRNVDKKIRAFVDIIAIYYLYLLVMLILYDIARISLLPIYLVTGGFTVCCFYLLFRHRSILNT